MSKSLERLTGPIRANVFPIDDQYYYRLLVKIIDGEHTVYVGNDSARIFTPDTLPAILKHKLAIIKSRPQKNQIDAEPVQTTLGLFLPTDLGEDDELALIGWRVSDEIWVVIVSQDELEYIKRNT